jgi:Fic family protein
MLEDEKNPNDLSRSLYTVEPSPAEAKNAKQWIKRARDKRISNSMENPFEDDQDIMNYLDRAIDTARNPLDQLELKMLHESLCREIHKEKRQKKRTPPPAGALAKSLPE